MMNMFTAAIEDQNKLQLLTDCREEMLPMTPLTEVPSRVF